MSDILIIRSNCDAATYGTYNIGEGLVAYLQGKGHTVTELADAAASPANVQYWLTSAANRTTKLVIALDHGSATGFYGEVNNQITPVVTTANVKDLTQNLHVYTFACSTCSPEGLADTAISQGTLSWLGYVQPVYVFTDPNSALFKTLKDVIWSFITSLADGFTLETAEKALRDAYTAHKNDNPVFSYNLNLLKLCKKTTGMTIHSHNRLGGKSLIGTWGGMVAWEVATREVATPAEVIPEVAIPGGAATRSRTTPSVSSPDDSQASARPMALRSHRLACGASACCRRLGLAHAQG